MIEFYRLRDNGAIVAINRAIRIGNNYPGMLGGYLKSGAVVLDIAVSQEQIASDLIAISANDALTHNGRVYARAVLVWAGYPIRHTV